MDTRTHPLAATADVIVIGGGPVGMTTALALAARGTSVILLEQRATTSDEPKAISLDDESLRLYQSIGIIDRIVPIIVPGTGTRYYGDDDAELFHARAAVPYRLGHPFKNPFAQPDLERALFDALLASPLVDVLFETALHTIERNDDDGVEVIAANRGGEVRLAARFLVGADGGRSTVRRLTGIPMVGRSFDDAWLVADTTGDPHTERYGMHHGDSTRPTVVIPGLDGRCRYEFRLFDGEGDPEQVPSFELIERLVGRHRPITREQVERAVVYRFHALNAARWREGSAFLAGDAAHMMPPFAGQGLNSGLRDAANLSWKLAEALRQPRSTAFLDSYESERRPHAAAVIASSVLLGRVVMTTNRRVAAHRDRLVREALTTPAGRAFFEEMRYRPPYRLESGFIANHVESALVGTQLGQPLVFDFDRRRPVPFDALLGTDWALIGVDVETDAVTAAAHELAGLAPQLVSVPLDDRLGQASDPRVRVAIDLDTRLYAELGAARGRLVLVRPDRFIAAVWSPEEPGPARRLVAELEPAFAHG